MTGNDQPDRRTARPLSDIDCGAVDDSRSVAGQQVVRRMVLSDLNLPTDASNEDVHAAVFRHLAGVSMLPNSTLAAAVSLIADRSIPDSVADECQDRFANELVADFCVRFFELPLVRRQTRHRELMDECEQSPLAVRRLECLEAGLEIDDDPVANVPRHLSQIGTTLQRMFVADPEKRLDLYHSFLRTAADQNRFQSGCIADFQMACPELAALGESMLTELELLAPDNTTIDRVSQCQGKTVDRHLKALDGEAIELNWNLIIPSFILVVLASLILSFVSAWYRQGLDDRRNPKSPKTVHVETIETDHANIDVAPFPASNMTQFVQTISSRVSVVGGTLR